MKFAFINVNLIFENSKRGRELTAKLQAASRSWQTKWQEVEESRNRVVSQIKAAETRKAMTESMNLQRDLQGIEMELSYLRQRGDNELKAQVQQSQDAILQELAPLLATFAKEQGLAAVFTLPATPALYVDPDTDVTEAVIAYYDSHLKPVAKPAPAGRPGAPRSVGL